MISKIRYVRYGFCQRGFRYLNLYLLQLNTANEELKSKNDVVAELEGQLETLRLSLETIQSEVKTKDSRAAELEGSKATLETTLQETKDELAKLGTDYEALNSTLGSVKEEVSVWKDVDLYSTLTKL